MINCAECEALAAQTSIAEEEAGKIRDQIAAALQRGAAPRQLLTALERLERTHQKCLDALDRHRQSHFTGSRMSETDYRRGFGSGSSPRGPCLFFYSGDYDARLKIG